MLSIYNRLTPARWLFHKTAFPKIRCTRVRFFLRANVKFISAEWNYHVGTFGLGLIFSSCANFKVDKPVEDVCLNFVGLVLNVLLSPAAILVLYTGWLAPNSAWLACRPKKAWPEHPDLERGLDWKEKGLKRLVQRLALTILGKVQRLDPEHHELMAAWW